MDKFLLGRKRLYTTSRGGYITLISVLLVGAVGTAVAVSLLLLGLGASRTSFVSEQSAEARGLADACAEEALQGVHDALLCTGGGGETFGDGSCASAVTSDGLLCTIDATGTVGAVTRKTKVILTSVAPVITMLSWREVSDF